MRTGVAEGTDVNAHEHHESTCNEGEGERLAGEERAAVTLTKGGISVE